VANAATIVALVLVRLTGNPLFDSIFGVMVAGWIAWSSLFLIWSSGNDLMDVSLPEEEVRAVIEAIERADPAVTGYRELRTRRAAGVRFIDFELLIDRNVSFERARSVTIGEWRISSSAMRVKIATWQHALQSCFLITSLQCGGTATSRSDDPSQKLSITNWKRRIA
jgi:Co/Zn/Cd efflux system component